MSGEFSPINFGASLEALDPQGWRCLFMSFFSTLNALAFLCHFFLSCSILHCISKYQIQRLVVSNNVGLIR